MFFNCSIKIYSFLHSFKCLGARFNDDATCVEEVKTRLGLARDRMGSLATLWRSKTLSNESKARLIQALIWPIVTYGAEAWTLNKELTGNIEAFEMQCYRRALQIPIPSTYRTQKCSTVWGSRGNYWEESRNVS